MYFSLLEQAHTTFWILDAIRLCKLLSFYLNFRGLKVWMLIFFYIRFAIVCSVLGILGNGLTMFVLLANKNLRKQSTTPFLLSLTLSDLIFCSFNLPLTAARLFYTIKNNSLWFLFDTSFFLVDTVSGVWSIW